MPVTVFSTPIYARTQLEPSSLYTLFEDDMASATGKWNNTGSLWSEFQQHLAQLVARRQPMGLPIRLEP